MKSVFSILFSLMSIACFGQLDKPSLFWTTPYIGNGLMNASNNLSAQKSIGIDTNTFISTNVLPNFVTTNEQRAVAFSNDFSVHTESPQNGSAIQLHADANSGDSDAGTVSVTADAMDINTTPHNMLIASTNSADSSWGEIDIASGTLDFITGNFLINGTSIGSTYSTIAALNNSSNVVKNFSLTNGVAISNNVISIVTTNSGLISTNIAYRIGSEGTNNLMTASNNLQSSITANTFLKEGSITNLWLAQTPVFPQFTNGIRLSIGGTNLILSAIQNGLWTNSDYGWFVTNALGNASPYQYFANGTLQAQATAMGTNWTLINGSIPPKTAWAVLEDDKRSGIIHSNQPITSIIANGVPLSDSSAANLSSNQVVQAIPEIHFYPNKPIQIWDGTNYFTTNFPSSTTFGFNEVQAMFPWRTNGTLWSGGKMFFAAGEYDATTIPIIITNNWTIIGAGHLQTIFRYTGTTNGYTVNAMTNAFGHTQNSLYDAQYIVPRSFFCVPTNKLAVFPISEFTLASPNVSIQGITFMTATNCAMILFSSFANDLFIDDCGFGDSDYLNGANGGYRIGYLDKNDVNVPSGVIGMVDGGSGLHLIQRSDFGGLADSMIISSGGRDHIHDNTFHVAGEYSGGNNNIYSLVNASIGDLDKRFHVDIQSSYSASIHNNFYDEAQYATYPTGEGTLGIYAEAGYQNIENTDPVFYSFDALEDWGWIRGAGMIFDGGAWTSDGSGNVTAVSFIGSHSGNGSGLTGITMSALPNVIVTNNNNGALPQTISGTNNFNGSIRVTNNAHANALFITNAPQVSTAGNLFVIDATTKQVEQSRNGSALTNIVAQPNLTFATNTIYATTNSASVSTVSKSITLGTSFSNDTGARARFVGNFIFNDTVGGSPILVYSNMTTGLVLTNGFPAGLSASAPRSFETTLVSPNDSVNLMDKSTGGTSISFVNGYWIKE